MTATTPTAAPGPSPKLNEVEQTIAMVQAWHDGAEYASDDPELDRIDFSKIISVLGDFRTALLASAAGGENDPDRSLWALEKAREIANQICSDSSPPTFRAKLIDLVMGALYTAPPPPVGELQGVSEEDVKAACELIFGNFDNIYQRNSIRHALESFAASRPVAGALPADSDATQEQIESLDDLVTLVRRLVRALRNSAPDNDLTDHAVDYLQRKGFNNGPFRSATTPPSAALTTPKMTIAEAVAVALVKMPRSRLAFADSGELLEFAEHIGAALTPVVAAPQAVFKSLNAQAADLLRPFLKPGQKVIWREAFRWHDDDGVLSNHYDGFELPQLAEENGYSIAYEFDLHHAAIIVSATGEGKTS